MAKTIVFVTNRVFKKTIKETKKEGYKYHHSYVNYKEDKNNTHLTDVYFNFNGDIVEIDKWNMTITYKDANSL